MARAYSEDLRKRVLDACNHGASISEAAKRFAVSESFVEKLKRQYRRHGTLEPKPHRGGRKPLLVSYDESIRALLSANPDMTLEKLRDALGISIQLSTLWYHLKRLGLHLKNRSRSGRSKTRGS
jgi:transposase